MSSSPPRPESPGLSRQPGDHPLRPARGGRDTAMVHRALRQPAQPRACDGHRGGSRRRGRRGQVAALIGADAKELVFTSGATESNNIAIKGAARFALRAGNERRRIVTVATEHKCVLESVADLADEGFEPVFLPVRPDGLLDPEVLRAALEVPTLLVSVMSVNNEIGVVQDIAALAAIAKQAGALFHTDIAQATGKIPLDLTGWKVDLASISGHKLYGPKGVGALFVRRRPRVRLSPLFSGGGQERGLRSGTLPAPLIVGLGEACRLAQGEMSEEAKRLAELRDRLLDRLRAVIPGVVVNGSIDSADTWQPERDLPRRLCRGPDGARPGPLRFHRLGVFLRRDRTVLCAARHRPGRRSGIAHLAHRDRALYLARRYRLCGNGAGCGACGGTGPWHRTVRPGLNGTHWPDAEDDLHRTRRHASRSRCTAWTVGAGDRAPERRRYRGRVRRLARLLDLPRDRRSRPGSGSSPNRPRTRRTCWTWRSA